MENLEISYYYQEQDGRIISLSKDDYTSYMLSDFVDRNKILAYHVPGQNRIITILNCTCINKELIEKL